MRGDRALDFVLLGHPVGHSLSPVLHRAAFEALGIEADYRAVDVGPGELEPVLREAAGRGGGNVTLPYKLRAAALLDEARAGVRATGACNCFWGEDGRGLVGENTDLRGFLEAARALLQSGWPVQRVLLLGAGGAAAAILAGCREAGVASVDILNRTGERARAMAARVAESWTWGASPRVRVLENAGGADGSGRPGVERAAGRERTGAALRLPAGLGTEPYDLVVNATRLGLGAHDPLPLALGGLGEPAVLDLVYGPEETPWVRQARAVGLRAADGLRMLVEQAAASLTCWLGVEAPRTVMLAAAEAATGRRTR